MLIKGMKPVMTGIMICALTSVDSWSGTDPISFTVNPKNGFPTTTMLGGSYSFKYILTNNLPFDEVLEQISYTNNRSGFTVTDSCSHKTLAANGGTCIITIVYQPEEQGEAVIKFTVRYDNNVVQPILSTITKEQKIYCSQNTQEVTPVPLNPNNIMVNNLGFVSNCPFGYNLVCESSSGTASAYCISGQRPKEGDFSSIASNNMFLLDVEHNYSLFPNNVIFPSSLPTTCDATGPSPYSPLNFPTPIPSNESYCVACNTFICPGT
ncbi:MAG: hypothetical protein ACHP9Y_04380 [Gammaproteobacteria bacterium]